MRVLLLSNKNKKLQHHFTVTMVTTQISRINVENMFTISGIFTIKLFKNMTIDSPLPKEMIVNEVL